MQTLEETNELSDNIEWVKEECPYLNKYTNPVKYSPRNIVGRKKEMDRLLACLSCPELCNAFLIGEAGSGKTMLVQGIMANDKERIYLEINLAKMIADYDPITLGNSLTQLFGEVSIYKEMTKKEVVLFIDEFHQLTQLSPAAVEAMKPILADSGTRGIKIIAATTYEEFRKYIAPNQPLVERFQRINLSQPGKAMTIAILKGMAVQYGVNAYLYNDSLYELIYEYTNRYIPSNSQPRKSIRVLDAMVGWHRATGRHLDKKLLADVIYESEGVNVAFRVDATKIKETLDEHVYAQQYATKAISDRLQIAVADLHNKSKPMSSFLFTGSTGVGKTEMAKQLAHILFGDGGDIAEDENQSSNRHLIRFDMTEYSNSESVERFRKELSARIWERPFSIVLLDEIEKACAEVTRELIQVLDDGRLTDENGRQVVFTNSYIIMTTNGGSEIYKKIAQYNISDTGDGESLKKYTKAIRESISSTVGNNKFPPELLGRIDVIAPFQPLSEETLMKIIKNKILKLEKDVSAKHNIILRTDKNVLDYIVKDNLDRDSNSGGARAAVSKFEEEVVSKVARCINENPEAMEINVKVEGNMAFNNKNALLSEAYITVCSNNEF